MAQTPYTPRSFTLPEVPGISQKTLEAHLGLYQGYVKHANLILEKIEDYSKDVKENGYVLAELQRRFAFEFDGMRNHGYYFTALEGGALELPADAPLRTAIEEQWSSFDACIERLKVIAGTRGVGWAMLYYDPHTQQLTTQWVDEQHLGHLNGLQPIVAIDMWEHSYLMDYAPGDKGTYVDAYLNALNWETIASWYEKARG